MNDAVTGYECFLALKWMAEGATSLEEIAQQLEEEAGWLRRLAATGKVEMPEAVENGHAMLLTEDAGVAEEFGFQMIERDDEDVDEEDEDA